MSVLPGAIILVLSLLLLHALVAPGLHLLAHWLYRGAPPARADRGRARTAFLLLASSPVLVLVVGLSALGHLAEGESAWAGLVAACRRFHEHCDLLLGNAAAELPVYAGLLLLAGAWLGRAGWQAAQPALAARRLLRVSVRGDRRDRLARAIARVAPPAPVEVIEGPTGVAVSAGFLRPRILLSVDVLDALDTDQLAAVLAHEAAHLRGFDAVRGLAIRFAGALSPLGGLSCRAERAYELDREILCDDDAVSRGVDPLALADALVRVARLRPVALGQPAATGTHDIDRAVRTRVHLLLGLAGPRVVDAPARTLAAGGLVVLAATALPHAAFGLLVSVHCGVEALVHLLA